MCHFILIKAFYIKYFRFILHACLSALASPMFVLDVIRFPQRDYETY